MILIDSEIRQIEDNPTCVTRGIAEDAGRTFVYYIDKSNGKHYIEEAICKLNLESSLLSVNLKWIDDDYLHQVLQKFFHDKVFFKEILEHNKRLLDKG